MRCLVLGQECSVGIRSTASARQARACAIHMMQSGTPASRGGPFERDYLRLAPAIVPELANLNASAAAAVVKTNCWSRSLGRNPWV